METVKARDSRISPRDLSLTLFGIAAPLGLLTLLAASSVSDNAAQIPQGGETPHGGPASGFSFCGSDGSIRWMVGAGGTLWEAAQRFNTSAATLQTTNRLSSTTVHRGDILTVPVPCDFPVGGEGSAEYESALQLSQLPKFVSLNGKPDRVAAYSFKPWTKDMQTQVQDSLFAAVSIARLAGIADWRIVRLMRDMRVFMIDGDYSYAEPVFRMLVNERNSLSSIHEAGHFFLLTNNDGLNEVYAQGFANYWDIKQGRYIPQANDNSSCGMVYRWGTDMNAARTWYDNAIPAWAAFERMIQARATLRPDGDLIGKLATYYARWIEKDNRREGAKIPIQTVKQLLQTDYGISKEEMEKIFSSFPAFDCGS